MSGIINRPGSESGIIGTTELDYEEGDWTPKFEGTGGSGGSIAYGSRYGRYTKIGRLVTCAFEVLLTNHGSYSGSIRFDGLPYTSKNDNVIPCAGPVYLNNINYSGHMVSVYIINYAKQFYLFITKTGGIYTAVTVPETAIVDTSGFGGTFSYWI
jgi:hypothetical protein